MRYWSQAISGHCKLIERLTWLCYLIQLVILHMSKWAHFFSLYNYYKYAHVFMCMCKAIYSFSKQSGAPAHWPYAFCCRIDRFCLCNFSSDSWRRRTPAAVGCWTWPYVDSSKVIWLFFKGISISFRIALTRQRNITKSATQMV